MTATQNTLTFTGDERLAEALAAYAEDMSEEVARAMFEFGGRVLAEATELTPIKTGELRSRGFVEGPFETDDGQYYAVVVGYEKHDENGSGDYYAVPVHERTHVHHDKGQAKFLEEPFKRLQSQFINELGEAAQKVRPNDRV